MNRPFRTSPGVSGAARRRGIGARAFSMVELLVVLSIVMVLTGLLMPGITKARRSAYRLMCASNLRQIGTALMLRGEDHNGFLPDSHMQELGRFGEMSAINTGEIEYSSHRPSYDGLGILWEHRYLESGQCLYCPAHRHEHTYDSDAAYYDSIDGDIERRIHCNYHFVGPRVLDEEGRPTDHPDRNLNRAGRLLLVTDSLRSREDFNHADGMNVLFSDFSTVWEADTMARFSSRLPDEFAIEQSAPADELWVIRIWNELGLQD